MARLAPSHFLCAFSTINVKTGSAEKGKRIHIFMLFMGGAKAILVFKDFKPAYWAAVGVFCPPWQMRTIGNSRSFGLHYLTVRSHHDLLFCLV